MRIQLASLQCIPPRGRPRPKIECNSQQERAPTRERERGLRWCGKRASERISFLSSASLPPFPMDGGLARSLAAFAFGNRRRRSPRVVLARVPANLVVLDHLPPLPGMEEEGRHRPTASVVLSVPPRMDGRAPATSLSGASPALLPAEGRGRSVSREGERGRGSLSRPAFHHHSSGDLRGARSETTSSRIQRERAVDQHSRKRPASRVPIRPRVGLSSSASPPPPRAKRSLALQDPPPRPRSHAPSPLLFSPLLPSLFPLLSSLFLAAPSPPPLLPSLLRRSPGTDERA